MPFPGSTFKVTANDAILGQGTITVLEDGFLFEAVNQRYLGFDFDNIRLVRVTNVNSFDVAYSLQGSFQRATFTVTPRYLRRNEGVEKDVTTNPLEWELAFWKLHTITGAVGARVIADRSGARIEGIAAIGDEEFERDFRQGSALVEKLPFQNPIHGEERPGEGQQLSLQLERVILKLTDAWLTGRLSPTQREKVAAMCYLSNIKKLERGWSAMESETDVPDESHEDFGESANEWTEEESLWGSDLKSMIEV